MKRLLVIGSEGFIGSHIRYKLADRYDLVRADTGFCGDPDYLRTDVTKHEEVARLLDKTRPDVVLNLAGEYGILNGEEHPAKCFDVNTMGVLYLSMECAKRGVRLVHLSTGDVYGTAFDDDFVRGSDIPVTAPRNIYSLSKLSGEAVLNRYREDYGLDGVIIRPFMVYGQGEPPTKYRSAMVRMCNAAAHSETLVVHRGAERAWMHVHDFAEAVALVIEAGVGDYNIGSEDYVTMQHLAEMICSEAMNGPGRPTNPTIEIVDPPEHFRSMVKRVDFSDIHELGWYPTIPLEEGIERVVGWCRTYAGSPRTTYEAVENAEDARRLTNG